MKSPARRVSGSTPIQRWARKVVLPASSDGCWEWAACRYVNGYGMFAVRDRHVRAHRFAYETFVGSIPEGLGLDHLCRNKACVNPEHLEPVTQRVNVLRGVGLSAQLAKRTHCRRGHLLSGGNLLKRRYRGCRACKVADDRERRRTDPEYLEARRASVRNWRAARKGEDAVWAARERLAKRNPRVTDGGGGSQW